MPGEESDDVGNTGVLSLALFGLLEWRPRVAILSKNVGTLLHKEPHDLWRKIRNLRIDGLRVPLC